MLPNSLSAEASSILLQLVQAYNLDLFSFESAKFLRLEQDNYDPLIIKHTEPFVMSLGSYCQQDQHLVAVSEVTFLIRFSQNNDKSLLFPIAYRFDAMGIVHKIADLNKERNNICSFKQQNMANIIGFCNQWALDIQSSTWFLPDAQPNPQVSAIANSNLDYL